MYVAHFPAREEKEHSKSCSACDPLDRAKLFRTTHLLKNMTLSNGREYE